MIDFNMNAQFERMTIWIDRVVEVIREGNALIKKTIITE